MLRQAAGINTGFRQPDSGRLAVQTMTIETTYTAARKQLKALMDRVVEDREVLKSAMVMRAHDADLEILLNYSVLSGEENLQR